VHLRRALLLFTVVVGLAAIAAAVSQPREAARQGGDRPSTADQPEASPRPARRDAKELRFSTRGRPARRGTEAGDAAVVVVEVGEPGQVALQPLGITSPAEPRTPARFDLFPDAPGRLRVVFTPAGGDDPERVGTIVVRR
jgi:hypothetical protein